MEHGVSGEEVEICVAKAGRKERCSRAGQCGWNREVQMRWAGGVEAGSSVAEMGADEVGRRDRGRQQCG